MRIILLTASLAVLMVVSAWGQDAGGPPSAAPRAGQLQTISPEELAKRQRETLNALQTIRGQIELYRIQHADRQPTLDELQNAWSVMMTRTDMNGTIKPRGPFGPYMSNIPESPLMHLSGVVAHGKAWSRAGWTYDEKTFHVRAVVHVALFTPTMSADDFEKIEPEVDQAMKLNAERAGAVIELLRSLDNGNGMYCLAHNKTFPTFEQLGTDWQILLNKTDVQGRLSDQGAFGPFLRSAPMNPFTGKTKLAPHNHPTPDAGWTYDETTHVFRVLVPAEIDSPRLSEDQVERMPAM